MKNIFRTGVMALAAVAALSSCSDWTDPEPVGNKFQGIGEAYPDTYAKYLENLRDYRNNGHKKAYAWFANQASFASQADHILSVPDSIDVLVLHNPQTVSSDVLNEMVEKRSSTGMQMAYVIDYSAMRQSWQSQKEVADADGVAMADWGTFMADSLPVAMGYAQTYGFDRIVVSYDGKNPASMTSTELAEYNAEQQAFVGKIFQWGGEHSVALDLLGIPGNLTDSSVLDKAGVLFLSESLKATNTNELTNILNRAAMSGVPAGKFGVMAPLPVLDTNQATVGHWGSEYTAVATARWARGAEGLTAMGMTNLYDGYYNPTFQYPVCRVALQTLNPAAK